MLTGGCLCNRLRYEINGRIIDAGFCHCRLCQRANAAPVVAWGTTRVDHFAYSRGTPAMYFSSPLYQREFCAECGTQIGFRRRVEARMVDFTLASLDDPALVPPEYHIWQMSKLDWFDTGDRLPRHDDAGPDQG
ncbi:MAG: GFA family protein [Gammaproteobacteria bacterium]|nr:GFA family protein [Gammaproteobacteria bacterium]